MEKKIFQSTVTLQLQHLARKIQLPIVPEIDLAQPALQSTNNIECRICLQSNDEEGSELISPCNCTGSVRYIHSSCFKKWVYKKYEDPVIRGQIMSHVGLKCQICKQKYQFSYSVEKKCATFESFCKKLKNNRFFFFGNILFVLIDIILLSIACNYARQDLMSAGFDIKQPRYFLIYIAITFASGCFIYWLYQFIKFFLFWHKFVLNPQNKVIQPQTAKDKLTRMSSGQNGGQQESNLRIIGNMRQSTQ